MNSFIYSFKKDGSVWWLMLISSVTLVICNLDLGWRWPNWCYSVTAVMNALSAGAVSSSVFYIIMTSLPNARDRHYKIKKIYDNLMCIKSVLMDFLSAFCSSWESAEVMGFGRRILDKDADNLHLYCREINEKYSRIIEVMDILPDSLTSTIINWELENQGFAMVLTEGRSNPPSVLNMVYDDKTCLKFCKSIHIAIDALDTMINKAGKLYSVDYVHKVRNREND